MALHGLIPAPVSHMSEASRYDEVKGHRHIYVFILALNFLAHVKQPHQPQFPHWLNKDIPIHFTGS